MNGKIELCEDGMINLIGGMFYYLRHDYQVAYLKCKKQLNNREQVFKDEVEWNNKIRKMDMEFRIAQRKAVYEAKSDTNTGFWKEEAARRKILYDKTKEDAKPYFDVADAIRKFDIARKELYSTPYAQILNANPRDIERFWQKNAFADVTKFNKEMNGIEDV